MRSKEKQIISDLIEALERNFDWTYEAKAEKKFIDNAIARGREYLES